MEKYENLIFDEERALYGNGIIVSDEDAALELKVGTYRYFKDIEKNNLDTDKLIADLYAEYKK